MTDMFSRFEDSVTVVSKGLSVKAREIGISLTPLYLKELSCSGQVGRILTTSELRKRYLTPIVLHNTNK